MRIKSPLSNLSETIKQIKESAAQYRDTLQRNEAATRAVLIDPILQALGWDSANTYMVEVEKTLGQTRVDYALYDRNASVAMVVEAKPLGTNLDDNAITTNIVKYAYVYKTKQIILTDGLVWKLVTILDPGNMPIEVANFATDSAVDCASFLVQHLDAARFWSEEQSIDELAQRIAQLESGLATIQMQISQLAESQAASSSPAGARLPEKPSLPVSTSRDAARDGEYVDLTAIGDAAKTAPSLLRLPDGTEIRVTRWKDVLRECCKFALANTPDIPIPLPDRSGRKVRLLDTVRPPAGISFIQDEYNGQTIYIYANYDAKNCIANAIHILSRVPAPARMTSAAVIFHQLASPA